MSSALPAFSIATPKAEQVNRIASARTERP
jgi:hypothetical protein